MLVDRNGLLYPYYPEDYEHISNLAASRDWWQSEAIRLQRQVWRLEERLKEVEKEKS